MKTSEKYIDEILTFEGLWGIESKCGLKCTKKGSKTVVIVTELYRDNPGSSITSATRLLAKQVCDKFDITQQDLIYIESSPETGSKLGFYDEEYYLVDFDDNFINPKWTKLDMEQIEQYAG